MTVLIIRTRYLGDTILLVPLIREIQRHDREARITVVLNEGTTYPLERFPGVEILPLSRGGPLARSGSSLALLGQIRRLRPDLLLDLTVSDRSRWMTRLARAGRTGAAGDPADLARGPWEVRVPVDLNHGPDSIITMQGRLLSAMGLPVEGIREKAYFPDPRWQEHARGWLRERDLDRPHTLFLHPGGRHWFKRWPPDRFARLASLWIRKRNGAVIVAGTGEERTLVDSVVSGVTSDRIHSLVAAPVGLLDAVIRRATLFVGNDSGPLHMADAAHIPVVGLFGSTLPQVWGPVCSPRRAIVYRQKECSPCHHTGCTLGPDNCLASLSVEEVDACLERLL
ncbi:MAG: glycosyltransferase family 9 protein [Leptospirillia bacterium]